MTVAILKWLVGCLGGLVVGGALPAFSDDPTVGHMVQLVVGLALLAWACPFVIDQQQK